MEVLVAESSVQQERLQVISEKRRRQEEIQGKRQQLDDDRRQLQHLKSKALRERWLLDGTPPTSDGDEALRQQMEEDERRAVQLEASISRLETEIEALEKGDSHPLPSATPAAPTTSPPTTEMPAAPSLTQDVEKVEVMVNSQQTPVGTPKAETRVSSTPVRMADGTTRMKAAMYSVEITVEKDKVTGETRVLSSSTRSPQQPLPRGVKVYEDETKVVHAVDGAAEDGAQPLSASEVAELLHKADEAVPPAPRTPPARREIPGVRAVEPSAPPAPVPAPAPVTMVFMGYQSVEDEAETRRVLGVQDSVTAELVVLGDAPPNGTAAPPDPAPPDPAPPDPAPPDPAPAALEDRAGVPAAESADADPKKQPCKCCSVM